MLRLNTTTTQRKVFLMASLITLLFACGKSETKETQRAASDSEVSQETRTERVETEDVEPSDTSSRFSTSPEPSEDLSTSSETLRATPVPTRSFKPVDPISMDEKTSAESENEENTESKGNAPEVVPEDDNAQAW